MSSPHSQRPSPARTPAHTVRIVKKRRLSGAAAASLAVAAATATLLFTAWRMWRDKEPDIIPARTVSDVVLLWKCDQGHTINAPGQAGTRTCSSCGKPMYPTTIYACEAHGPFEIAVQFTEDAVGDLWISNRRTPRGRWVEEESDLVCPRCGRPLIRKDAEDLGELGGDKGKTGG